MSAADIAARVPQRSSALARWDEGVAAAALVISNSAAEFEARKSLLSLEIELLRIRGLEQAADQANLQAGIDRARQGVNDRVSNIAYQNNRA